MIDRIANNGSSVEAQEETLVSIVIPTYNRSLSLFRTLESVFQQSYRNFEVIVVDDGSQCDITHVVAHYPVKKTLRQVHSGANVARNNGWKHASGEYLLFLDDDICLDPTFLEKMVNALNVEKDAAFSYCNHGSDKSDRIASPGKFDANAMRKSNYISGIAVIRRSRFPGFDARIRRLQDWDLWLTMIENGDRGIWVPEVLFRSMGTGPRITDDSGLYGPTYDEAYEIVAGKHHLLTFRYHFMSICAKFLEAFPERFGKRELLEFVVVGLRVAGREGIGALIRQVLGKTSRREP
jgi:glycosyltransferase involved in cell wall biosynthesis